METTTLSESFKALKDPSLNRAKRHTLINIITIAICAVICGALANASILFGVMGHTVDEEEGEHLHPLL